jgi:type II secretory pathway component GspD/PulD (secretin)
MRLRPALGAACALALVLALAGCGAARSAYRQGNQEARQGNWDMAVARYTLALQKDPENIGYRIALQNARVQASRYHLTRGRQAVAAQDLERAREELEIAVRYDSSNQAAVDQLDDVRAGIRAAEEARRERSEIDERRERAAARVPLPVLEPGSRAPINLKFTDQSLHSIFEALARLTGVNILIDPDLRDESVSVTLTGVTFQQALDQITFVNKAFYKVLNPTTLIVVPETAQKRRTYDENLVQTFYLENADVNEMVALLTKLTGIQKTAGNEALKAITVMGTLDELALAERIIRTNDKARGEVMVEVQILEVNRTAMKQYGLQLSNYQAAATFSPTGAEGELGADGLTTVRAHILSSLNLADFIISLPSAIVTNFLRDDTNVRILATPRLRAAEGDQTQLLIGTEVPIPVTTFTATQAGAQSFAPATSFQYRNVGVTLQITPEVSTGGEVALELEAEFSLLGDNRNVGTGSNPLIVPTFLTRRVTGTLRLRDGETSLLGGLLLERETETIRGVLGLQNLPLIGGAFRSTDRTREDTEILISITPYIVRAPRVTEEDLESLYAGTRERVEIPGARPPLFGPAPEDEPAAEDEPEEGSEPDEGSAADPEALGAGAGPGAESPAEPVAPIPQPTPYPEPSLPDSPAVAVARALFRPGELSLTPGQMRELDLVVLGAPEFGEVELVLTFDPERLAIDAATPGALLTLSGDAIGVQSEQQPGRLTARFRHPARASGSGAVARLQVRGLVPGTSLIEASLTLGSGDAAQAVLAEGRVVVVGSP